MRRNKSPFTDEEPEEFRAMLFSVTLQHGCGSAPLYQRYMGSYNNYTAMRRQKEAEQDIDRQAEAEAVKLLESKGYKVSR